MSSNRILTYLCYAAMMGLSIGLNLLPIFLVPLQGSFPGPEGDGLTGEQLGRLGAVAFAGLVVGILVTGPLADRLGAKLFGILGNIFVAVCLVLMAWAPSYQFLLMAMFGVGVGSGVLDMVLSPVVAALNPHRRSAAMNMLHSFYCLGAVVTALGGTALLWFEFGWRETILFFVPLPLVLALAMGFASFPHLTHEEGERIPFPSLLKQWWFIGALVAIFLGGATELGMAQWLPAYAEKSLDFPKWIAGASLAAFSIAMTIGRAGIGLISERVDSYTIMAWGCGLSVVLFLIGSFFPDPVIALSACILVGLTGSCLWPTMLAVTADRYPNGGATMFGALAALGNAGGIFMPWTVGAIADISDLHWGLAVSAFAPFLMLPIVIALGARRSMPIPAATPNLAA